MLKDEELLTDAISVKYDKSVQEMECLTRRYEILAIDVTDKKQIILHLQDQVSSLAKE